MREIALHLLDIAENSVSAQATAVSLTVVEDLAQDRLTACVADNGRGMDAGLVKRVTDPFTTSRTTRKVGLGIPLLKFAAESCNGGLEIDSAPGEGTRLEVSFQHSHIDRMPLGDLATTMLTLVVAYPQIDWELHYEVKTGEGSQVFFFESRPIREVMGDIPLTEPDVLAYIREQLEQGIRALQQKIPAII